MHLGGCLGDVVRLGASVLHLVLHCVRDASGNLRKIILGRDLQIFVVQSGEERNLTVFLFIVRNELLRVRLYFGKCGLLLEGVLFGLFVGFFLVSLCFGFVGFGGLLYGFLIGLNVFVGFRVVFDFLCREILNLFCFFFEECILGLRRLAPMAARERYQGRNRILIVPGRTALALLFLREIIMDHDVIVVILLRLCFLQSKRDYIKLTERNIAGRFFLSLGLFVGLVLSSLFNCFVSFFGFFYVFFFEERVVCLFSFFGLFYFLFLEEGIIGFLSFSFFGLFCFLFLEERVVFFSFRFFSLFGFFRLFLFGFFRLFPGGFFRLCCYGK